MSIKLKHKYTWYFLFKTKIKEPYFNLTTESIPIPTKHWKKNRNPTLFLENFNYSSPFAALELNPAWLRLLHSGLSIGLVVVDPFVVPEGSTGDAIHYDEDDQYNDVDDGDFPPALLQAG